eukprot:gene6618-3040_t
MPRKAPPPKGLVRGWLLLLAAVAIDAVGMLTYFVPLVGELADAAWAPVSAVLVNWLFRTR